MKIYPQQEQTYSIRFLMSAIYSYRSRKNKEDVYIGKDCMKRFCEFSREHAMKIINSKKRKNEVIKKRAASIIWKCK